MELPDLPVERVPDYVATDVVDLGLDIFNKERLKPDWRGAVEGTAPIGHRREVSLADNVYMFSIPQAADYIKAIRFHCSDDLKQVIEEIDIVLAVKLTTGKVFTTVVKRFAPEEVLDGNLHPIFASIVEPGKDESDPPKTREFVVPILYFSKDTSKLAVRVVCTEGAPVPRFPACRVEATAGFFDLESKRKLFDPFAPLQLQFPDSRDRLAYEARSGWQLRT